MFFKNYDVYENKLSEQLSDDNPYKKKLIEMETPSEKHPIYTILVWSLLIYCWMFFIAMFYKQINQSYLYNLKLVISSANIIFVTLAICLCYKKNYLIGTNSIYRRNSYIIFVLSVIFSVLIETADSGNITRTELVETFFFFYVINSKSYIALAIVAFIALGIASSYYTCPYELYRGFYSVNKIYNVCSSEKKLLDKWFLICAIGFFIYLPLIYMAFTPAKDDFNSKIKLLSVAGLFAIIPFNTTIYIGRKYYKCFAKAYKQERRYTDD